MIVLIAKIALGWAVLSVVTGYIWGCFAKGALDEPEAGPASKRFANRYVQDENAVVLTLE